MDRLAFQTLIKRAFSVHPIVALLGPRQCGKTTIARAYFHNENGVETNYFDLEDPLHLARLENPKSALDSLRGLIVIDEIQRSPDLFPYLRVLADRTDAKARFLILGSASRQLIKQSSESLAGRIQYLEVTPFNLVEVGIAAERELWLRGGFPRSFLADSEDASMMWRDAYIRTYLEQDVPNLGISIPPQQLRRFWMMLAHYHGQIFNAAEIAGSLGLTAPTVKRYLDILSGTFMVRELQPWIANLKKRQVKSPKIYLRDSGIYHRLLQVSDGGILMHPKLGASWEGFALEETIRQEAEFADQCYFWAVHAQAEIDLLIQRNDRMVGYEFKFNDVPKLTKSMVQAKKLLNLNKIYVVYPGTATFELGDGIIARPVQNS